MYLVAAKSLGLSATKQVRESFFLLHNWKIIPELSPTISTRFLVGILFPVICPFDHLIPICGGEIQFAGGYAKMLRLIILMVKLHFEWANSYLARVIPEFWWLKYIKMMGISVSPIFHA
jgi:hypothetical protein